MRSPLVLASTALVALGIIVPTAASAQEVQGATVRAQASHGPENGHIPLRAIQRRSPNASQERNAKAALQDLSPVTVSPAPQIAVLGGTLDQPGVSADPAGSVPPDTTGSIGPSHYLEATNNRVGAYSRASLGAVSSTPIDTFTGRAGSCDPQVQWDQGAGRWFWTAIDCTGNASTYALLFGWSKTSDPSNFSTGWCRFFFNTSSTGTNTGLPDYPKLGHNSTFMIIGTNDFNPGFTTSRIWTIPKPANGDTSCSPPSGNVFPGAGGTLNNADGTPAFTPEPANEVDNPVNGYIVGSRYPGAGAQTKLMLWRVGGAPATLTAVGDVTVPSYNFPPNIPQPGTGNLLDSSDTRLTQAVGRTDASIGTTGIWTQHTVNVSGRAAVRWYEINPSTKTIRQTGLISSTTLHVFNGAISPTNTTDAAAGIQYNTGSASEFVKVKARSRMAGDALNGMFGELTLGTSSVADTDFSCSPCRWGDYAGASPDMSNNLVVWGSNQLNGTPAGAGAPQWITRNFALMTRRTVVSLSGSSLSVSAPNGVGAGLGVTKPTSSTLQVTDSRNGVKAGTGCTASGSSSVSCPSAGITTLSATAVGGITPVTLTSPLP